MIPVTATWYRDDAGGCASVNHTLCEEKDLVLDGVARAGYRLKSPSRAIVDVGRNSGRETDRFVALEERTAMRTRAERSSPVPFGSPTPAPRAASECGDLFPESDRAPAGGLTSGCSGQTRGLSHANKTGEKAQPVFTCEV